MNRITPLMLVIFFMGCGGNEEQNPVSGNEITPVDSAPSVNTDPDEEDSQDPVPLPDCQIEGWDVPLTPCGSLWKNGILMSKNELSDSYFTFAASKKNGGSGGTRWFDAKLEWNGPRNFLLPREIPATGNAGNGQKLYIRFNDTVDCVWYSHAGNKYRNPRCFIGATRSPGNSVGFSGGTESGSDQAFDVRKIWVNVNGAAGSGVITTVNGRLQRF